MFKIFRSNGKDITRSKIVIPLCRELGSPEVILRKVVECVEGVSSLKRVILSTISPECFGNNLQAYLNVYNELID
jgi:hypothetical protein